ncbi:DUF4044 domain-containing protein [Convivina intestini]|uniref:Uncharacterized protein DUF2633 n=1 Tax=Convivina intestini TaxID=1505726 RepID=A0A2U1D919_9LACO|nr:DUF4044 domain-containing protein [Convivina intestini]PVY84173.1 uncharacterized protein DUF2633 [Convivina intestini]CAH1854304.1 hypothetical protein R077811_00871 [Convivina intestini]CAH1854677.1 hypothetical protein R078131_01044 [Convivina intestini]SDB91014.1 Protein of unknown function [Leuconostocaceae bacterium R-53105]
MATNTKKIKINKKLADEVTEQLDKRPIPKVQKKEKTKLHRLTLFMSFLMVFIMVGGVIYAAVSALGLM